jgi:hypothetical protein
VSESWTDPGSLKGEALSQWYLRSPADVERERQEAAARRYQDFFYGRPGRDLDPEFGREVATSSRDVDPGFAMPAPSSPKDIDPGLTGVADGPNRFRSVRMATDGQSTDPSSLGSTSYSGPRPAGRSDVIGQNPHAGAADPAANARHPLAPAPGSSPGQTITYGALRAPAPSDDELTELRRRQATFADTTRKIDLQNSWFAAPELAAPLAVMGLEGAAAWAARTALPEIEQAPLQFVDREAWQRGAQKAAQALSDAEKNALRGAARTKFARANGVSASEMQAEVHHSDPLEWAHLKPDADPNRLANLWGLRKEAHAIATREWSAFTRSLEGRLPSPAELMEAKLRIDRLVEPYIRRAGLPRSNRPPGTGGPL